MAKQSAGGGGSVIGYRPSPTMPPLPPSYLDGGAGGGIVPFNSEVVSLASFSASNYSVNSLPGRKAAGTAVV